MNWIVITMVLALIVLMLLIALIVNSFKTTGENTGCSAYNNGRCIPLGSVTSDCSNGQTIFTNDCKRSDNQACCVELIK